MRRLYRDNGMRAMVGTMIIPTMQARCVGGTTLINSAICFRLPDDVLDEWVDPEGLEDFPSAGLAPLFDMTLFLDVPEEELERRLIRRWLDHGSTPEAALDKALGNDIPNARLVAGASRAADITLTQEAAPT